MAKVARVGPAPIDAEKPLKLVIFLSSCRPGKEEMGQWGRLADRVGLFVRQQLEARGHALTVFDPKVQQLPLLVKAYHHYASSDERPALLTEMGEAIKAADAFVVVSAEYNHQVSGQAGDAKCLHR